MSPEQLHEPWRSFLHDIDAQLSGLTEIHCLGGFVVDVLRIGGKGSALAKKHRVYIDIVTVPEVVLVDDLRLVADAFQEKIAFVCDEHVAHDASKYSLRSSFAPTRATDGVIRSRSALLRQAGEERQSHD